MGNLERGEFEKVAAESHVRQMTVERTRLMDGLLHADARQDFVAPGEGRIFETSILDPSLWKEGSTRRTAVERIKELDKEILSFAQEHAVVLSQDEKVLSEGVLLPSPAESHVYGEQNSRMDVAGGRSYLIQAAKKQQISPDADIFAPATWPEGSHEYKVAFMLQKEERVLERHTIDIALQDIVAPPNHGGSS